MTSFRRHALLAAALASIGAVAAPTGASATVTPVKAGNVLTVTSNADSDTITLAVAGGVITVNGTPTTLNANEDAEIVVDAGGGVDTVDATALAAANYKSLVINGGEGDDLLTGGADDDLVLGDGGNDRVIGFRGTDELDGGEGDDVLVWNKGDGTDVDDGGEGADEVEVNGDVTLNDAFTAKPDALVPGRVQFNRTNLVTFGINLSAERLTVNGQGGEDTFAPDPAALTGLAGLTTITVNGGSGADQLTGGDGGDLINGGTGPDELSGGAGADLVRGGDDADELSGDGGDDRLIGDRGADAARAGEGDDVMVWNNGDGTDFNQGDAGFDRVEVNGSPTAGDVFKLSLNPNAALSAGQPEVKFERTNLVPFAVNIHKATTEAIAVSGGGGNDVFTVLPGLRDLLVAGGGDAGNDTLVGSEEPDSFFGGSGNDVLVPGAGSDLADGEVGDDLLFTRDKAGDLVRGGTGTDSAQTDAVTVDANSGIEKLDATPVPAPPTAGDRTALVPKLGKAKVVRSRGKLVARVPVSCPAAETGGCRTTLTLQTAKAVKLGRVRASVVLGSKTVRLRGGQRTTVSIRLARGASRLAKRGKLAARARIATADAAGNLATRSVDVALRIPRR